MTKRTKSIFPDRTAYRAAKQSRQCGTGERVVGREIYQAYVGFSANPGFRDFAIAALIV